MQKQNKLHWGYIAGIVSGITYGMNPLFGVPVINKGLDVNSLLFYRYGVATLLMLAYMLVAKRQIRITWKQFGIMTILGVLFTGCSITLFEAYKYIPSGIATSILYVYPIMVALIMMFFGQYPSWKTWISIFAGVAGAICSRSKVEAASSIGAASLSWWPRDCAIPYLLSSSTSVSKSKRFLTSL